MLPMASDIKGIDKKKSRELGLNFRVGIQKC